MKYYNFVKYIIEKKSYFLFEMATECNSTHRTFDIWIGHENGKRFIGYRKIVIEIN